MQVTIHTALITDRDRAFEIVSASHDDLIARVGDHCRRNWPSVSSGPPPENLKALVDDYFASADASIEVSTRRTNLPEPYSSGPKLLAALQDVADTPKHGEPDPSDTEFSQDWEADMGQCAIGRLHELIDSARATLVKVSVPAASRFTVFCQEARGGGTIHIDHVEATDLESAIIAGKQQCIDDWSAGMAGTEAESPWNMETVHCLGVATGEIEILHWQDLAG